LDLLQEPCVVCLPIPHLPSAMTCVWWVILLLVNISYGSDICFEDASDPTCSMDDRSLIARKNMKGTSGEDSISNEAESPLQTGCYTNPQCERQMKAWKLPAVPDGVFKHYRDNCIFQECRKNHMTWNGKKWHRCHNEGDLLQWSYKGTCDPIPTLEPTPQPTPGPTPELTPQPTPAPELMVRKKECVNVKTDLIFLVDSSGSVGQTNIQKTAKFLKDVVKELPVGKDEVHVGIVQFSGMDKYDNKNNEVHHTLEIELKDGTTPEKVNKALDNMKWHGKGDGGSELADPMTYTGEAINHVLSNKAMFPSASKDAHKMLVIITDGKSNSRSEEFNVKKMSDKAREKDILVIAVGIGKGVNQQELKDMADGKKENIFEWGDGYSNMEGLAKKLKERTKAQMCEWVGAFSVHTPTPEPTVAPMPEPTLAPTPEPTMAEEGFSKCYNDEDYEKEDCKIDWDKIPPEGSPYFRRRNSKRDFCIQNECQQKGLHYDTNNWKGCGGWKFKGYCHKR